MNKIIFILIATVVSGCFLITDRTLQPITLEQVERDLVASYHKVLSDNSSEDPQRWEKVSSDNQSFREMLLSYAEHYPGTLTHPFDSLQEVNIDVVSSADSLFRIYSWDTMLGGTMHLFENVFQFKSGDRVEAQVVYDSIGSGNTQYIPFYSEIFTLRADQKTYYLAVSNGMYSTKDVSQSVKVFTIENQALNDTVQLFQVNGERVNELQFFYDFFSVVDRPERPVRLITYDSVKKRLYVPVISEAGEVTEKFMLYQFNGTYFESSAPSRNEVIEKSIYDAYTRLMVIKEQGSDVLDSLIEAFPLKVQHDLLSHPETLSYPFDMLKALDFKIKLSEDSLFKVYNWDSGYSGGIPQRFELYQYAWNNRVYTYQDMMDFAEEFWDVYTVKDIQKTYYLVHSGFRNQAFLSESLRAFTVEGGRCVDDLYLFKTPLGLEKRISTYINYVDYVQRNETYSPYVRYDKKNNMVIVPYASEEGIITSEVIRYRFNGKFFEQEERRVH